MSGILHKVLHPGHHEKDAHHTTGAVPVAAGGPVPVVGSNTHHTQTNVLNTQTINTVNTQQTTAVPVVERTAVNAPIIQETVRQDKIIEVQPVVHREVDKNVVHHIEKHIQEAPAPNMGGVVEKQAIVQQNIHTNVINEVQPIIHRERVVPVTERVEQHLTQRVVEPTIHTHEVIYENAPSTYSTQTTYQGLNYAYSGASAHPTYGYQRLPKDRKAERFEAKALEWERRGNAKKAQKNRDKALRIRQKLAPGYVRQAQPQSYYVNRANVFDQKALQYQQWGMQPQAQRYQQRSQRVRGKHGLPVQANAPLYTAPRV